MPKRAQVGGMQEVFIQLNGKGMGDVNRANTPSEGKGVILVSVLALRGGSLL